MRRHRAVEQHVMSREDAGSLCSTWGHAVVAGHATAEVSRGRGREWACVPWEAESQQRARSRNETIRWGQVAAASEMVRT